MHVDLGDRLQTLQSQVRQHVGFDTPQKHIIFHFIGQFFVITAGILIFGVHNSDTQHQFFRIVIVENAVQIVTKTSIDFL